MTTENSPASAEGFDVRIGWRRDDARLEADAIALWERTGILPDDVTPAERAKELVAGAYAGGQLIALCTAVIAPVAFLRARFLVLRSMADPAYPRQDVQAAFAAPVRRALEGWAVANPAEGLAGVVAYIDPRAWGELAAMPVWPIWPPALVGYTDTGMQIRACWFDHFQFD